MNQLISVEQERLRQAKAAGQKTMCRCCRMNVKVYPRHLNGNHAAMLCFLVYLWEKEHEPIYFRRLEFPFGAQSRATVEYFSIMKYWKLIRVIEKFDLEYEAIKDKRIGDPDVPQTGYYTPTTKGIEFAYGRIKIQKTCLRFANTTICFQGEHVSIFDVKDTDFAWADLMGMLV